MSCRCRGQGRSTSSRFPTVRGAQEVSLGQIAAGLCVVGVRRRGSEASRRPAHPHLLGILSLGVGRPVPPGGRVCSLLLLLPIVRRFRLCRRGDIRALLRLHRRSTAILWLTRLPIPVTAGVGGTILIGRHPR